MKITPPLRRRRRDLLATGAITVLAATAVGGAWLSAPVRTAHSDPAAQPNAAAPELTQVPEVLAESFSADNFVLPGNYLPVVASDLTIAHDSHTARALDNTGKQVWSYSRSDLEICSLSHAWDKVVVTYRSGIGCGEVVALDSATGQYAGTRSSVNDGQPFPLSSNDRVGVAGPSRLELWRSDLVRTVEYGRVEAKQEPGLQPHEGCEITSALTRTELLAVTEICPDDPDHAVLRLMNATPEESRTPEIHASVTLASPHARLVAIGQNSAAIYAPGSSPELVSYSSDGNELSRVPVEPSPLMDEAHGVFIPPTADLPHHMTWYDGSRLYLLEPDTLHISHVLEGVSGTGVGVGDTVLVPVTDGLVEVDWVSGQVQRTLPVDRKGYDGPVHLNVAGGAIVESRGSIVAGLVSATP